MSLTGYLASVDLEHELRDEMAAAGRRASQHPHGRLVVSADEPMPSVWAANVWRNVEQIPITSIGHAAKELRDRQRNWALYAPLHGGRARLIAEKLPSVSAKPVPIGGAVPDAPLGSWTLLDPDLMLAAGDCSSPFPNGEVSFVENRTAPPNRAYLKLWEALTLIGRHPGSGERCLDLGSSPGGWTWALHSLDARVISVDKAPLAPEIAALPRLAFRRTSAFALAPRDVGPVDWLFSDVACYPTRLLALVERWLESGLARNFVCTLKFQGATDHATARRFAAIPGSRLLHLHHNKHELTWVKPA